MIFAADLINFEMLIPIALFGTFAALAWWALELVATGKPRTLERLDELKNPEARRNRQGDGAMKQSDAFTKMLEKATPALAKPLTPKTEMELGKLKTKLANAGFRSESAGSIFLGAKFIGLIAGILLGGGIVVGINGTTQNSLLVTVAIAGVLFYVPDLVVGLIGKSRKDAIFLALPDALDLMVVCVEAGLGLDQAMRRGDDEMIDT